MKSQQWISSFGPGPDGPVQVHSLNTPPPSSQTSRRRRRHRPRAAFAAADLRRKFVSGQFDEENPFVLISSVLLVQPDEGVSVLVVDRIGDYLPQSTEKSRVLVIPVGARHKCQQDRKSKFMESRPSAAAARGGPSTARDCARTAARCSRHERARCVAWRVDMREPLRNTAAGSVLPCAALGERWWPPRAFLLPTFCAAPLLPSAARDGRCCDVLLRAMDAADLRDRRVLLAGRCALEGTRSPLASPVVAPPVGASRRNCGALVARKIHDGGGRRPVAAPASFRRCRDGWSEFF
ncbi:hypothetical protein F511_44396 [Dorcoceras hygrometricum]|uniref:Uncharacterized protein n=1 Tax=Dorcoceras hygrometricum TaxID=472368 RepID=A0A2Z7B3W9_9LAMI|nr:hypothetical protein F511_44396 [Dorcoceras hygrometricum]